MQLLGNRRAAKLGGLLLLATAAALPQLSRAAGFAAPAVLIADVDVNVVLTAPPPPREEVVVERDRPSRDHVWVKGYWAWRGSRHEWVGGHWERPPHGKHEWVEPRWERSGRGYVFVQGFWR